MKDITLRIQVGDTEQDQTYRLVDGKFPELSPGSGSHCQFKTKQFQAEQQWAVDVEAKVTIKKLDGTVYRQLTVYWPNGVKPDIDCLIPEAVPTPPNPAGGLGTTS